MKRVIFVTFILFLSGCDHLEDNRDILRRIELENRKLEKNIAQLRALNAQSKRLVNSLNRKTSNLSLSSLSIVDGSGKERIKLFVDSENVTRLRMYRNSGELTNSIFSYPKTSNYKGISGFSVTNGSRASLVSMTNTPNKSSVISIAGNDGKMRAVNYFNYERNQSGMEIYGANQKTRGEIIGLSDGRTIERLVDPDNKVRIASVVMPDYKSYQMHFNNSGEVLQGVYVPLNKNEYQNYSYKTPGETLWGIFSNIMTLRSAIGK